MVGCGLQSAGSRSRYYFNAELGDETGTKVHTWDLTLERGSVRILRREFRTSSRLQCGSATSDLAHKCLVFEQFQIDLDVGKCAGQRSFRQCDSRG